MEKQRFTMPPPLVRVSRSMSDTCLRYMAAGVVTPPRSKFDTPPALLDPGRIRRSLGATVELSEAMAAFLSDHSAVLSFRPRSGAMVQKQRQHDLLVRSESLPDIIDREREDDVQVHSKFEGKTLPYATQSFMGRFFRRRSEVYPSFKKLHKTSSIRALLHELQKEGVDPNALNEIRDAPIHTILKRVCRSKDEMKERRKMLLALLVHSDADVNKKAGNGWTALHFAVKACDVDCVKVLIAFGADVNARNNDDQTPIDLLKLNEPNRLHSGSASIVFSLHPSLKSREIETSGAYGSPKLMRMMQAAENTKTELLQLFDAIGGKSGSIMLSPTESLPPFQSCVEICGSDKASGDVEDHQGEKELDKPNWRSQVAVRYAELEHNIEQRLLNVTIPLTNFPDEACSLAVQMRELRMYKQAYGSRILFLDGGGIRGLLQIEILIQLEEATGRGITELFDWIVGTSTGGIVALGLVYAKKTLSELRKLYFRMKDEVFGKSFVGVSYDTDSLEKILKEEFGEEMIMNDVTYPRVLIPAVKKEYVNLKIHFFNNCFNDEYSTQPVWLAARCTSAAPILFSEHDNYVDGGILANNPSESGLTKIQNFYRDRGEKLPISLVVSVGGGKNPVIKLGSTDVFAAHSFDRTKHLLTLFSSALGESEVIADNCRSRCKEQGIDYYRLNPRLEEVVKSGETSAMKLVNMILQTKRELYSRYEFSNVVLVLFKLSAAGRTYASMA